MITEDDLTAFGTYEEYLDSQVTTEDLFYLEDEDIARRLVELGYRGSGEVLKKEEFDARKATAEAKRLAKLNRKISLTSSGKNITEPFMKALADREADNRSGDVNTIIFVRCMNPGDQLVSGYIDYKHRLVLDDFTQYFRGVKRIFPRQTDLSYYNWNSQDSSFSSSPNFEVITDVLPTGILFKSKKDKKIIDIDPSAETPGENTERTIVVSPYYMQIVLFDHTIRRKV